MEDIRDKLRSHNMKHKFQQSAISFKCIGNCEHAVVGCECTSSAETSNDGHRAQFKDAKDNRRTTFTIRSHDKKEKGFKINSEASELQTTKSNSITFC